MPSFVFVPFSLRRPTTMIIMPMTQRAREDSGDNYVSPRASRRMGFVFEYVSAEYETYFSSRFVIIQKDQTWPELLGFGLIQQVFVGHMTIIPQIGEA